MSFKDELDFGTFIETMEHGFSKKVSRKIAKDHLDENIRYYTKDKRKNYLTSKNNGHRHIWNYFNKKTSIDSGHFHKVNLKKMIAEKGNTDHTHKLLKKVK